MENKIVKKCNLDKLNKFAFCELISYLKFKEYKIAVNISKQFRSAIMFYINLYKFKSEDLKTFYEKNLIFTNKEIYENLITNILNRNSTKKQIKNLLISDCKAIRDFVAFMKIKIQKEIDDYPYVKLVKNIKINNKNIINSIKAYISNNLADIFYYEEVELNKLETDLLGCRIIADFIKKCDAVKVLDLSKSVLPEEGVECILNALDSFDDYYTLNLEGILLTIDNIRHIAGVMRNPKKKVLFTDNVNLKKKTKAAKAVLHDLRSYSFK